MIMKLVNNGKNGLDSALNIPAMVASSLCDKTSIAGDDRGSLDGH